MADELNLTLPEEERKSSRPSGVVCVLLVLLLIVGVVNLLVLAWSSSGGGGSRAAAGLSPEVQKNLALKLEKQGLQTSAAETWKEYLSNADVGNEERAKVWYRIGKLHQDAGNYERALEGFYRSESFAKVGELALEIARRTQECLEALGKFAALRYELAERVEMGKSRAAGEDIVAEIGPRKITKADLDRKIEEQIEHQISQFAAYLPPEERKKQKEELLKRFSSSDERLRLLNQFIVEEVLYRKARESKLTDDPATRALMRDVERKVLAQRVIETELADQIKITPADLQTYYEANKKDYLQPERAQISHIVVKDEKVADNVLKRLREGEEFEDIAKEVSQDEATKGKGGEITEWVDKGSYIPSIGYSDDAVAVIFSTGAGEVVDKAVKTDKGFHVIKVRLREPERQKTFEEVRPEAFRSLRARKEREVQVRLIENLKERYDVVIRHAKLGEEKGGAEDTNGEKGPSKKNQETQGAVRSP